MYLARDVNSSSFVFSDSDPRDDGFSGTVEPDVEFQDTDDFDFQDGAPTPDHVLCVSRSNPKSYRVFKYAADAQKQGFSVIGSRFSCRPSYASFLCKETTSNPADGSLRRLLHACWNLHGSQLMAHSRVEQPTPSLKRKLVRQYLDRRKPTVGSAWHPLTDHQKVIHLLDAFPDDDIAI